MLIYGSSLVFNVDSSHLRVGLRIYFIGLFLLLAFVGDRCCGNRVKLRLMKESQARISMMTGWLNAISAVKMWITQKHLPAGFFGILMIVAEVMSFSSDLLVSGLVKPTEVPGRCSFGRGIVLPEKPVDYDSIPTALGAPYAMAIQAQATNEKMGGLRGLYKKLNEAPNFRAESQDVVGHWNCVDIQHDVTYYWNTTQTEVVTDLENRGYLYRETTTYKADGYPDGSWDGLLAWGSSVPDEAHRLWDVKASMTYDKEGSHRRKIMRSYHCVMNAPPYEWVLKKIWANSTLIQWSLLTHGLFEQEPTKPVTDVFSSVLECMTMIGWQPSLNSTPIGDLTQGCLLAYAEVPWPLFGFLVLATLSTLLMIIYSIISSLQLRRLQSRSPSSNQYNMSIKDETPNGLLGWMTQAVREHVRCSGDAPDTKDIVVSGRNFGPDNKGRLAVLPIGAHTVEAPKPPDNNPTRKSARIHMPRKPRRWPKRPIWRKSHRSRSNSRGRQGWLPQPRPAVGGRAGGSVSVSVPFLRMFKQKGKSSVAQTGGGDGEGGGSTESLVLTTIRRPEGEGSSVRAASVNTAERAEEAAEAAEATEATDHVL